MFDWEENADAIVLLLDRDDEVYLRPYNGKKTSVPGRTVSNGLNRESAITRFCWSGG